MNTFYLDDSFYEFLFKTAQLNGKEQTEPDETRCLKNELMQTKDNNFKPKPFAGILLHLHPQSIRKEAIAFNRTFGIGWHGSTTDCYSLYYRNSFKILLRTISPKSLQFNSAFTEYCFVWTAHKKHSSLVRSISGDNYFSSPSENFFYWCISIIKKIKLAYWSGSFCSCNRF